MTSKIVSLSELLELDSAAPIPDAVRRAEVGLIIERDSKLHKQLLQNDGRIMKPGQIVEYDFRKERNAAEDKEKGENSKTDIELFVCFFFGCSFFSTIIFLVP